MLGALAYQPKIAMKVCPVGFYLALKCKSILDVYKKLKQQRIFDKKVLWP